MRAARMLPEEQVERHNGLERTFQELNRYNSPGKIGNVHQRVKMIQQMLKYNPPKQTPWFYHMKNTGVIFNTPGAPNEQTHVFVMFV